MGKAPAEWEGQAAAVFMVGWLITVDNMYNNRNPPNNLKLELTPCTRHSLRSALRGNITGIGKRGAGERKEGGTGRRALTE